MQNKCFLFSVTMSERRTAGVVSNKMGGAVKEG